MANFDAQVIDLVGSSWTTDQGAVDQFITEGANEVINAMPRSMRERIAEETSVTSGTTPSEGHKVLSMTRNDGTIDQPCRRIPAGKRGRVADSSDMEYATATDPAYYLNDGKFNILPSGGSGNKLVSVLTYSQESGTLLDASNIDTIANFPNEAEYLVVLYAAIKALQQVMNGKSSSLPTDVTLPSAPVAPEISTVSYTDATNVDASIESIVVPAKIDVSSNAPAFTKPTFTKPTIALALSEVTLDLFNEDLELASTRLQKVQAQISEIRTNFESEQAEFNSEFENEKAEFDKENIRYQMEFQEEVTKVTQDLQAEIEKFRTKAEIARFNKQQDQALNLANAAKQIEDVIADNNGKLQKYVSELQKYQAEVSSEIQNYSAKMQKQITDYQWIASQHQNLMADYQRGLQLLTGASASRGQ